MATNMRNRDLRNDIWAGRETVAGLFKNTDQAEHGIGRLKQAGFKDSQIGLAVHEESARGEKESEGWVTRLKQKFMADEKHEGRYDLGGTLQAMGLPSQVSQRFESGVDTGGVVVTVNCGAARCNEALSILEQSGADIGTNLAAAPAPVKGPVSPPITSSGERRIQLLGEILRVHKERINRGEVRVRKEVVTDKQTVEVPVSHEEVIIERRPASGAPPTTREIKSGEEIRIPVSEEKVRVEKQPVVTGEAVVEKRQVQDTEQVSDEVRHEELRVDKEGNVPLKDKGSDKKVA